MTPKALTKAEKEDIAELAGPAWDVVAGEAEASGPLLPNDITIGKFLIKYPDHSYASARRILNKKVKAGDLIKVKCRGGSAHGGNIIAYRKPEK